LISLLALHDANRAVSSVTLTLRTTVSPTAAAASPLKFSLEEYAPSFEYLLIASFGSHGGK
jgi:hypothetical protein